MEADTTAGPTSPGAAGARTAGGGGDALVLSKMEMHEIIGSHMEKRVQVWRIRRNLYGNGRSSLC